MQPSVLQELVRIVPLCGSGRTNPIKANLARIEYCVMCIASLFCHSCENRNPESLMVLDSASTGCVTIKISRISSSISSEKRRLSDRFLNYDTACECGMTGMTARYIDWDLKKQSQFAVRQIDAK
jgi:hypothetical protein